jgi:hypothetical protein
MNYSSSAKRALAGPLPSGSSTFINAQRSIAVNVLYYGPQAANQAQSSLQVHHILKHHFVVVVVKSTLIRRLMADTLYTDASVVAVVH